MEYLVGVVLAAAICLATSCIGFDRDRAFYPTVLMVVASYYALFAVMSDSLRTLGLEAVPIAVFIGLAIAGFKGSAWFLVAGLFAHAIFDFTHHHLIENTGVPLWWPGFCLAYDATAGAYLAALLLRDARRNASRASGGFAHESVDQQIPDADEPGSAQAIPPPPR